MALKKLVKLLSYNKGLENYQKAQRSQTIEEVRNTITFIHQIEGEDAIITLKKMLDNSNLSRKVLYKEQVLKEWHPELWKKKYEQNDSTNIINKQFEKNMQSLIEREQLLSKELQKAENTIQKLKTDLENERKRVAVYKLDLEKEYEDRQKLLNECQRLNDKLRMHNFI